MCVSSSSMSRYISICAVYLYICMIHWYSKRVLCVNMLYIGILVYGIVRGSSVYILLVPYICIFVYAWVRGSSVYICCVFVNNIVRGSSAYICCILVYDIVWRSSLCIVRGSSVCRILWCCHADKRFKCVRVSHLQRLRVQVQACLFFSSSAKICMWPSAWVYEYIIQFIHIKSVVPHVESKLWWTSSRG